jgi:hypothetical protein
MNFHGVHSCDTQTAGKGRQLGGEEGQEQGQGQDNKQGQGEGQGCQERPYSPTTLSSFFPELDERFLWNEGKNVARSDNF